MMVRIFALLAVLISVAPIWAQAQTGSPVTAPVGVGPETGYALPRYVSMAADEGNVRRGPSRSHRIDCVFLHPIIPLVVVAEHEHWRRVVDRDGQGGWMHYTLLSGARTAIVERDMLELRARPHEDAVIRARAARGVVGRIARCAEGWCLLIAGGHRGWVPQEALWGTDPGEVID